MKKKNPNGSGHKIQSPVDRLTLYCLLVSYKRKGLENDVDGDIFVGRGPDKNLIWFKAKGFCFVCERAEVVLVGLHRVADIGAGL